MRRYLEAGGKVVWAAGAPNRYKFEATGQFVGFTPDTPKQLLGLDVLDFEDSGNYYARATQPGRNLGLASSLKTSYAVLQTSATQDVTALALDEYGRVSAFVKQFVSRPGTGWISFSPAGFGVAMTDEQLKTFEHVASYTLD
jgi:hypothetical protein